MVARAVFRRAGPFQSSLGRLQQRTRNAIWLAASHSWLRLTSPNTQPCPHCNLQKRLFLGTHREIRSHSVIKGRPNILDTCLKSYFDGSPSPQTAKNGSSGTILFLDSNIARASKFCSFYFHYWENATEFSGPLTLGNKPL